MATSKIGRVQGSTIVLDGPVPELEGRRVRVLLEAAEEPLISNEEQRALWQTWVGRGRQGPIEDGSDTEFP